MHGSHADLLALLLLTAGSFLMPLVSSRIHVPSAVLLIGYGIVMGPDGLKLIQDGGVVRFLYEVGFIVLMFLAGMEIDFNRIRQRGGWALLGMLALCASIFAFSFLASWLLSLHPIYGLALGATSVGLPLAVLRESNQLRSRLGQHIILLGSVGEFLTVIGMTLFYFASRYGFSVELAWGLGKLIGVLAVAGLTLRAFMAFAWWRPERFSKMVEEEEQSEIGVRAALLLMMAFSMLAIAAGVESIVGAFLAGALIAFVLRGKEVLEEKLAAVGHGLFVPIFFVVVGMRFDVDMLNGPSLLLAGQLLVAAFLVKGLPSLILLRQGLDFRQMLGTASLLSAPLTLMVAIAVLGNELGVLGGYGLSTLIVLAVASGVVFPVIFRLLTGANEEQAN